MGLGTGAAYTFDDAVAIALGPLDELIGYHLRRAYSSMSADFAQTFADTGMRQPLFGALSVISANPGINQGQVGNVLGIQRTNMVALVNKLVDQGFVVRQLASKDRRAFSLTLTEQGQHILRVTLDNIRRHEDRMLRGLTTKERAVLTTLLHKIEAEKP